MKQVKRFFNLLLAVCILLGCITGSQPSQLQAKAMTRQQVNAKITDLEQQIKTLQSQKKTEEKREKKERAGAKYLYAEVVCDTPLYSV